MPDLRPLSIESTAITPDEIANRSFPTARRGLDADAVRRFLDEIAGQLRVARAREAELRAALDEAERRAASPELDEATLTAALGAETAKVIHAAHDAAREVVARAEARAGELTGEAERVLAERTEAAVKEADAMAARARRDADALLSEARDECRQMIEEAREARRRILSDLADRRRSLHTQIEQIRAAKDALAEVVERTAEAIGEIKASVSASEEAARHAADEAAVVASTLAGEPSIDELVAETLAARDDSDVLAEEEMIDADVDQALFAEEASFAGVDDPPVAEVALVFEVDDIATDLAGAAVDAPDTAADLSDAAEEPTVAAAEVAVAGDGGAETMAPSAVDELFARIRASRAAAVAEARTVLEDADSPARGEALESADAVAGENRADGGATIEEPPAGEASAERASADDLADEEDEAVEAGPRHRRDELLTPVVSELARAVKRTLRSEQNELLAAARKVDAEGLAELVPGDEALQRLADAAMPAILEAFRAGRGLASELLGGEAAAGEPGDDVTALATALSGEVVGRIRDYLAEALERSGDAEPAGAIVGAAYREWKGERVEVVAGDFATQAFSLGLVGAASNAAALVRWAVASDTTPCPDCDDNVLAGPQAPGEAFPTGQAVPPVHSGCRCLLLPVAT